jgi:hypothetical protein
MATSLITTKSRADWDLPVFSLGEHVSITVFTSAPRAARFIRERGLVRGHTVSKVSAIDLIHVLLAAHEDGVAYLVVNPDTCVPVCGTNQWVIQIRSKLAEFAAELARDTLQLSASPTTHSARIGTAP